MSLLPAAFNRCIPGCHRDGCCFEPGYRRDQGAERANRYASGEGGKVYIIDEVHMLTEAFNALKTLEEPPAGVIFILATTDPSRLPCYYCIPLPAV